MTSKFNADYLRTIIFGAEDSLVSTSGVLFGMALSSEFTQALIMQTGTIVLFVEALSMGVGSYLSETETHEVAKTRHKDLPSIDGVFMFLSYSIFGFLTLLPYLFMEPGTGKYYSIGLTLLSLYFLGYLPTKSTKSAVRMVLLAGSAILGGFLIGNLF